MTLPGITGAASLQVSPIRVVLEGVGATETLEFRNEGDMPLAVELVARSWSQGVSGEDLYEPTRDLVFYPKIAEVGPGQSQLVRLTHSGDAPRDREVSYRLYLRQIPVATDESAGVTVLLGMSLPVFVRAGRHSPDPVFENLALAGGRLRVPIRNRGTEHVRVKEVRVEVSGAAAEPISSLRVPGWYVLPGAVRTFETELPGAVCARSRLVRVRAEFIDGGLTADLKPHPAGCDVP